MLGRRMRHTGCGARAALIATLTVVAWSACAAVAGAQTPGLPVAPIPDLERSLVPQFEGATASPNPVNGGPAPPRHPFMAPNGRSNIHNDAYQTDTYRLAGPLGDGAEPSSLDTLAPRVRLGHLRLGRAGS